MIPAQRSRFERGVALDPFFGTLAFYSRAVHHAELCAILLAGFLTLAYFAKRV
jgi:hypothetical protein